MSLRAGCRTTTCGRWPGPVRTARGSFPRADVFRGGQKTHARGIPSRQAGRGQTVEHRLPAPAAAQRPMRRTTGEALHPYRGGVPASVPGRDYLLLTILLVQPAGPRQTGTAANAVNEAAEQAGLNLRLIQGFDRGVGRRRTVTDNPCASARPRLCSDPYRAVKVSFGGCPGACLDRRVPSSIAGLPRPLATATLRGVPLTVCLPRGSVRAVVVVLPEIWGATSGFGRVPSQLFAAG